MSDSSIGLPTSQTSKVGERRLVALSCGLSKMRRHSPCDIKHPENVGVELVVDFFYTISIQSSAIRKVSPNPL